MMNGLRFLVLAGMLAMVHTLLGAAVFDGGRALAQDDRVWPVKGKLLGKPDKNEPGKLDKAENVSGIACSTATGFPRSCLIIDDETQSAQLVIVKDGEIIAGDPIPLIDDVHDGKPIEFDGEGVAFASGDFYVIGSHGHPRDKKGKLDPVKDRLRIEASIRANSRIMRVTVAPASITPDGKLTSKPVVTASAELRKLLLADPTLKHFADKRLDANGVTIEGIAVRDGRLYVGLRGPSFDGGNAVVLSVSLAVLFDGKPSDARVHMLRLDPGRGIRDLAVHGPDILVLAGPTADMPDGAIEPPGQYAIYRWDGAGQPTRLKVVPTFPPEGGRPLKPEAILPLGQTAAGLRVLVLFDGAKEGGARAIEIGN